MVVILFIVLVGVVVVAVGGRAGQAVVMLRLWLVVLAGGREYGRSRRRRKLGFHCRQSVGSTSRADGHQATLEDMRGQRGSGHVIASSGDGPQERQDSCYIELRSQGLGRSLGLGIHPQAWAICSAARSKPAHTQSHPLYPGAGGRSATLLHTPLQQARRRDARQ